MAAPDQACDSGDGKKEELETTLTRTVLNLEEIDTNLFRGTHLWKPVGGRAVFGGQVVGQALVAAGKTKVPHMHVHSLHCYFLRPGSPDRPILYHVERTRNGKSFSTRSVTAVQNGVPIFTMMVSYHRIEVSPVLYQFTMPTVPPPEDLASTETILREFLDQDRIQDHYKTYVKRILAQEIPIEFRPVDPASYFLLEEEAEPRVLCWVKPKGHLGSADNNMHRCVVAYMSDMLMLRTAIVPWPKFRTRMAASLDHSMWFHAPFRADEWMLYDCESPRTVGARSLVIARLWSRDGTLAVSAAQEGVIRGKMDMDDRVVKSKL